MQKLLISRKEAAEALNMSKRSIDHLIHTNRLAHRKIGARIYLTPAELERFAATDLPGRIWLAEENAAG